MPLNRKTVYADIKALQDEGYDIQIAKAGKYNAYYMASREFTQEELKILIEAVCAATFINHRQTRQLIQKLQNFTCDNRASELDRYLYTTEEKLSSKNIRSTNDIIYQAIQNKRQLSFMYLGQNGKEKQIISPYAIVLDKNQYYVIGMCEITQQENHFCVEKISHAKVLVQNQKKRSKGFNIDRYIKSMIQK